MKILIYLSTIILLLSSCNSGFHIEKRKYNKGFHISHSNKAANTSSNENHHKIISPSQNNSDQEIQENISLNLQPPIISVNTKETVSKIYNQSSTPEKIEINDTIQSSQDETIPDEEIIKKRRNNLIATLGFTALTITSLALINTYGIAFGILAALLLFPAIIFFLKFSYFNKELTPEKEPQTKEDLEVLRLKRDILFIAFILSYFVTIFSFLLVFSFGIWGAGWFGTIGLLTGIVSLISYYVVNKKYRNSLPEKAREKEKKKARGRRILIHTMVIIAALFFMWIDSW